MFSDLGADVVVSGGQIYESATEQYGCQTGQQKLSDKNVCVLQTEQFTELRPRTARVWDSAENRIWYDEALKKSQQVSDYRIAA